MPIMLPTSSQPYPECTSLPASEQEQCVRAAVRLELQTRQAILDQQANNRMILYIVIAAVIALLVLAFVYRRQIRSFLENLFIGAAAKSISTKRDFKAYREDIAKRVREKSE